MGCGKVVVGRVEGVGCMGCGEWCEVEECKNQQNRRGKKLTGAPRDCSNGHGRRERREEGQ